MSVRDPLSATPRAISACGTASVEVDDLAKVEIFSFFNWMTNMGLATMSSLESGETEVHFTSGEVFVLGASEIRRLEDRI